MPHAGAKAAKGTTVTISTNPLAVSQENVTISKSKNEEVIWKSDQDFVVAFEGTSPFKRKIFTGTAGTAVHSGVPLLTPDPGISLEFKYSVQVGDQVLDPGVIIQQ